MFPALSVILEIAAGKIFVIPTMRRSEDAVELMGMLKVLLQHVGRVAP